MKAQSCSASGDDAHVVKSAARTLEILEYFDEVRHPLNVVAVADALGYPQSSTAALLRSLTAVGYLHYNRKARTYMPTDRVPFLGSWINPPLFEEGALPRLIRAIAKRTGQLVAIAARNGDLAQYIHILNEAGVPHHIRIGQKRPLATSGVGQVLLSAMDDRDIRRLYHRMNAYAPSPADKIEIAELLAQLATVRKRGYTFSQNRVAQGWGMIALAVPTTGSGQTLALGVCGLCEVLEKHEVEFAELIREEMMTYLKRADAEAAGTARSSNQLRVVNFKVVATAANGPSEQVA